MVKTQFAGLLCILSLAAMFARWQPDDPKACKDNIRKLATALEMYASDWGGRYPAQLDALVPRYLPKLPTCPAAGRCSYLDYRPASAPDDYRFSCDFPAHRRLHLHADTREMRGFPDHP